jgi:hypothetical protein
MNVSFPESVWLSGKDTSFSMSCFVTPQVLHTPYGIEFMSLRYNCNALVPLRTRLKGEKAKIKYHPADLSCLHVYDPFERQYLRVPALDQTYTQGLSLWKHRVIRRAVLNEQDKVDVVALGQAKRKIQEIVEAGRQRKRQRTRSRIARWDTAGKPSRQVVEESQANAAPGGSTTPVTDSPSVATAEPVWPSTDDAPSADWEISYRSLGRHSDPLETPAEEGQDG